MTDYKENRSHRISTIKLKLIGHKENLKYMAIK